MRKSYKASYTLEASLVMPIVIFTIFQGMKIGIAMCGEVKESSAYSAELQQLCGVDVFRATTGLEELWGNLYGNGI